jgi:glucose/arabinose dehydrogenase
MTRHGLLSRLGIGVALVLLAGCTHGAAADATSETAASPSTEAATPGPTATPATPAPTADARACVSVQALMGHLSAATAQWSPNLEPFDKTTATRIRTLGVDLGKQASLARTPAVREVVLSNAHAFTALADAMAARKRARVTRTIAGTRVAYGELKQVCSFD